MQCTGSILTAALIAETAGGRILAGPPHAAAWGVCTDTRSLQPGQAFFALTGPNHDAHAYLADAAAGGATVLAVERLPEGWRPAADLAVVRVPDTERALLAVAARRRARLGARVAAVTGSYGKSSVKDMLGTVLRHAHTCTVAPASFNNRIGVALTLLAAGDDDEFVVLEMGTNHPGEIDELAAAARPDLGVITGIGQVHLEGLGSLDGVREAKAELIPHLRADGTLVLNADDDRCASLAARFGGQVRTFGVAPGADARAACLRRDGAGWRFDVRGWGFRLPSGARHSVLNAAAAICAATALGMPYRSAALALEEFRGQPMRYERMEMGGVTFIADCYNSNPPAMRSALESFLLEHNPGRKVVVCGDMLELGDASARLHREMGRHVASTGVDMLVAVGDHAPGLIDGWHRTALPSQTGYYFASAEQAWSPLWWELKPGDAVLLKGSRGVGLEAITANIAAFLDAEAREAAA